jgi:hypothetical protein
MARFARAEEAFDNLKRPIGRYPAGLVQKEDSADFALNARWRGNLGLQYGKWIRISQGRGKLDAIRFVRRSFARDGLVNQLGQAHSTLDRGVIDEMELGHHPQFQPMR